MESVFFFLCEALGKAHVINHKLGRRNFETKKKEAVIFDGDSLSILE